ncbi:glutathione peroxidase [Catenovulum sp. 2E275]|uniref:glutathione peroxidase n=1 Tax=Catenovulum sp. 2E275 TaxID=2980497 RepID=UPI0021CFCDB0|nr:glutathione peroxidase [Catenovulum sp. 2E275]MCU4675820.1 glutathione peroxidase [Catenovulum sp. 2E275]
MKALLNNKLFKPALALLLLAQSPLATSEENSCPELLNFQAKKLHSSKQIDFCETFKGKTLLVVNTASDCGFTPQFKELEALYQKYKEQNFEIIGFPSDDFFQERDTEKETAEVCYINYGVTFTMLSSSAVRGSDVNDFYKNLIKQSDTSPKWNFYKYLVNPQGKVVKVYNSREKPLEQIEQDLIKQLK